MPFKEPNRRDSWPPTILRLHDDELSTDEDIDENPFAYFLTSPTPEEEVDDDDFEYFEDLSAGIEAEDNTKTPVREVSPSSLQRIPLVTEGDDSYIGKGFAVPLSLRDFTLAHESKKRERERRVQAEIERTPSVSALRGRRTVRLTPTRTPRGRERTRSLSSQRPHSWREPSPDVWSIPEEKEDVGIDEAPSLSPNEHVEANTATKETKAIAEPPKKPKKRVHWAVLPRRDA